MSKLANWDRRPDLQGAKIVVAGLGASGKAALRVLTTLGCGVTGIDRSEAAVAAACDSGVGGAQVAHCASDAQFAELATAAADLIVVSPGIAPHSELFVRAQVMGIRVISEIELAWLLQAPLPSGGYAPWLTLTGTNGKTTTVTMTSAILSAAGLVAPAIGNVGTPAVEVCASGGVDVLPAELSSFQLHTTASVRALASACLNLDDDHLDWHGSASAYAAAKARIHRGSQVACLYSRHDSVTEQMVRQADVTEGARAISIGTDTPPVAGFGIVEGLLIDRAYPANREHEGVELARLTDLAQFAVDGALPAHVVMDALFAAALARAAGVTGEAVSTALSSFSPGEHRIQPIAEIAGVRYINDSKATNAHAARAALSGMPDGATVWLAGGLAKGTQFTGLIREIQRKLKAVVLIGVDQQPLRSALAEVAPQIPVTVIDPQCQAPMRAAVVAAAELSSRGDVVLLAPACASMDQFANYAVRGDQFAASVRELTG